MKALLKQYAYVITSVIAILVLAGACWVTWSVTDSKWQTAWDKREGEIKDASLKAVIEARNTEQRYQNDIENIRAEAQVRMAKSKADADNANAAIARLQQRINGLLASTSTEDTGTTKRGKTAGEALNLLADVLEKSIDRNRQLAAFADSAYGAGLTCEKSYDALTK